MSNSDGPQLSEGLERLDGALRRLHRSVLVVLAACAVVVAAYWDSGAADLAPARERVVAAVLLAGAAIILRQLSTSPVMGVRARVAVASIGMLCAGAIGGVAVAVASLDGAVQPALVFVAGAALLSLRRPMLRIASPPRAGH